MPNVFDKNYSFDSADRILSITDSYQSLLNQSFKHDALSRLTEQMTAEKTFKYTYDKNSNRLMRQTVQGTTTNTENYTIASNSNRLTNIQQGTSNKAYQYLATGQITNDGVRSYTYDAQGRSESISRSPNTILNAYDAFGQRIQKFSTTAGSQSQTLFVYDENGQLLGEYSPDGKVIREYIWLDGTLVGLRSYQYPNEILRVHTDHLGTPRAISNNQNQVVWRWDGDQFGDVLPTGTLTFPIRHAGQYYDQEVGIFYNYFRDYDPITGRYIESDPIGLDGGLNTYGYVNGSPIHYIDPYGLALKGAGIGGAIGGAVGWFGGGAAGGLGAGAACTFVAPGVGTIGCGGAGAVTGSSSGAAIGGAIGATVGSAIEDMCFRDNPKDCEKEIRECRKVCDNASKDSDQKNVWGGSRNKCMKGCLSKGCGGN